MQAAPAWALTTAYALHLLATVVWIGGLVSLSWLVLPIARRALQDEPYADFLGQVQARLQQAGWFSLLVLGGTGMFQTISHPRYGGLLSIGDSWALAILIKHITILGMVAVSAVMTWGITPALRRQALLRAAGKQSPPGEQQALERRERLLLQVNLALAVLVLLLTAWARAVS